MYNLVLSVCEKQTMDKTYNIITCVSIYFLSYSLNININYVTFFACEITSPEYCENDDIYLLLLRLHIKVTFDGRNSNTFYLRNSKYCKNLKY